MEMINDFVTLTAENLSSEHICCAISDKKGESCVPSKKAWLSSCFDNGLVFYKANVRGKVFIEYLPAEFAWVPIEADNYMHINCFWVSGQFKGKGYANELLSHCIEDAKAKGKCGLTILSSAKKKPFLSDPGHLKYKGFFAADSAQPDFVLYYLPFTSDAPVPKIKETAKSGTIKEQGYVLYYTNQCPHTAKYVPVISEMAKSRNVPFTIHKLETCEQAQNAPSPFTNYSLYYNGAFVTHEILSEKKIEELLLANQE